MKKIGVFLGVYCLIFSCSTEGVSKVKNENDIKIKSEFKDNNLPTLGSKLVFSFFITKDNLWISLW